MGEVSSNMKQPKFSFEDIFEQNKNRVYYQLHRLGIWNDPWREYFQEGTFALWNAYQKYQPDKGPLSTYFNYIIRYRLIDLLEKEARQRERQAKITQEEIINIDHGNRYGNKKYPLVEIANESVQDVQWERIKSMLTDKQWKWIDYYIIQDMSVEEIAVRENVHVEAVKSWGRGVRKKLQNEKWLKE